MSEKVSATTIITGFSISAAIVLSRGNLPPFTRYDAFGFALCGAILLWIYGPWRNRSSAAKPMHETQAFRLGKQLKRRWRALRRVA